MIPRKLIPKLLELAGFYPVVVVTGPRQAGKTTLCRAAFPDKAYVSLESLDTREFAQTDPRGFLAEYRNGAIIDEIQQAPGLASYLQTEVDERPTLADSFSPVRSISASRKPSPNPLPGAVDCWHCLPRIGKNFASFPQRRTISTPCCGKAPIPGSMTGISPPISGSPTTPPPMCNAMSARW